MVQAELDLKALGSLCPYLTAWYMTHDMTRDVLLV
jgi:hypothetical protein